MCFEGRKQLALIAGAGSDFYLSDQAYTMGGLGAEGGGESYSSVDPPFHNVDRLHSVEPDASVLNSCSDGKIIICMVGRVAPNKSHPALIEAFAAYHHDYNPHSRLIIVGKEEVRLAKYATLLRAMARRLELQEDVIFTGEVSDRALRAYYAAAHVFMITSEHEGFCVPLVEAMAMKIPIVAYASTAIPETVGTAGLVWEERNPYLLAESVNSIVRDDSLDKGLSTMGCLRYQKLFTNPRPENPFLNHS